MENSINSSMGSNCLFIITGVLFYHLSFQILRNQKKAYHSTLLFLYNPASIHFSALYSESSYSLLSLLVIDLYFSVLRDVIPIQYARRWMLILIAIITMIRSNGVLLLLFYYPPLFVLQLAQTYIQFEKNGMFRKCLKYGVEGCMSLLPLLVHLSIQGNAFW